MIQISAPHHLLANLFSDLRFLLVYIMCVLRCPEMIKEKGTINSLSCCFGFQKTERAISTRGVELSLTWSKMKEKVRCLSRISLSTKMIT